VKHKVCVSVLKETYMFEADYRTSVRDILDTTTQRVRAACGGTGTCGACTLIHVQGPVSPLTTAEYMKLSQEERSAGVRLACQLRIEGDVEVRLEHPAPPSIWKSIPAENLSNLTCRCADLTDAIYGVAVDLGTTHIRVSMWDRKHGKRIATRCGPNPQGEFGADVLNRLEAAITNPEHAETMEKLARVAVVDAVRDILARDVGEVSHMLLDVGEILIVGNTSMLALITGQGAATLMVPEHWGASIDCRPLLPDQWQAQWRMPNARFALPAPVAGFVGSDLVADLIATELADGAPGALLLDVGTNTEIALWDGKHLYVTSVPGGPAFEGVGIKHGMPAEPGAIYHVERILSETDEYCQPSTYKLETVAGTAAKGFCGSGLTDGIAVLIADKILKPSGRFAQSPGPEGYRLDPNNRRTAITGVDVDAFQRAKAAMAAAVSQLLLVAEMSWSDLDRLCICGAFGHTLNIANAQSLGLLPPIDPAKIELFADASLAGCEKALLSPNGELFFTRLMSKIKPINLSLVPEYEDMYIDHLRLRPIVSTLSSSTASR
jgi:uncharacterized 2Fe-2S/4Fe-4S cluster protein (DUF4445 family)